MMYEDLVKRLREGANEQCFIGCFGKCRSCGIEVVLCQAADAIEELQGRAKVLEKVADKWCEAVPKWIPVTERLPNEYGDYLVLWRPRREGILPRNKLFYEIVEYEMDYNGIDGEWIGEIPQSAPMGGYEVCYWMDLPPEPRKEKLC